MKALSKSKACSFSAIVIIVAAIGVAEIYPSAALFWALSGFAVAMTGLYYAYKGWGA